MNRDDELVAAFGDQLVRFDQSGADREELERIFDRYFAHFPWSELPADAIGVDVGCGTGRWAEFVAPRVWSLTCLDASDKAVAVARDKLARFSNCRVVHASIDDMPVAPESADFVYVLGVLHYVPDPQRAIRDCVRLLKPGGILYLYVYYSFENRSALFRATWRVADGLRRIVSRLPRPLTAAVCEAIAAVVYWPLARVARLVEILGINPSRIPLAPYRRLSLYTMRTDARDRFGSRFEHRFSRAQIADMLEKAGLVDIDVPNSFPYWIALGRRGA